MKRVVCRFFCSLIVYSICVMAAPVIFVMPLQVVRFATFLPPLLGLMWGPVAAAGVFVGELLIGVDWQAVGRLMAQEGVGTVSAQSFWVLCRDALCVFLSAYLPFRLWHSCFVRPGEPVFSSSAHCLLKFVGILFLTFSVTSVFQGIAMDAEGLAQIREHTGSRINSCIEYVLLCFVNDFNIAIFFGSIWFFYLISRNYAFYQPKQRYLFRPVSPETSGSTESAAEQDVSVGAGSFSHDSSWKTGFLFFLSFFALFVFLDISGIIYDLDRIDTWRQYSAECLTMVNVTMIALFYLLLRYRHSIMMDIVLLDVVTVFVSAAVLGWGCFFAMDYALSQHVEQSMEEMSAICRERMRRTFDGIRVSVNGMKALALHEMESYDRLVNDEAYRQDYLKRMERFCELVAAGTDGSIAFYLRCDPSYAGPIGGFSWEREADRWEGAIPSFYRRVPIDLSKYEPTDVKNVGWFYIPMQRHHATWIEPYIDPLTKDYVISYVAPFYEGNHFVGIVGMDIDFEYLVHEVRRMAVYEYGHVYLTDRNDKVLYHRDYEQGADFVPDPDYYERETYLFDGVWLGIAMPRHDVYAERNNMLMHLIASMLFVAIVVSIFSIWLASRGIRPLLTLTAAAKRIAAGNLDVTISYQSENELGALVDSIREMVSKLEVYVYRDKLTGLRNTAAYMRKGAELDKRRTEESLAYAVVVFDANFLKRVNDRYGHEAGNELIRRAANIICRVFAHSPVFRVGGDEFVAILEKQDYEHREQLLRSFDEQAQAERFEVEGDELAVSVARGIGVYRSGMEYAAVFHEADAAMYEHKMGMKKEN